jgi:proteasome alpha subunit
MVERHMLGRPPAPRIKRPEPRWLHEQENPLTLAAGIRCRDGVVLFADTEITLANTKTNRHKIFLASHPSGSSSAAIAGAGDYDFIKKAIQLTEPTLSAESPPSLRDIASAFEDAVGELYTDHVWPNKLNPEGIELMIAAWTKDDGYGLFKTHDTALIRVDHFEAIGTGEEIGEYLLKKMYREDMSVDLAMAVAVYILSEAKRSGRYVGGQSEIVILMDDGEMLYTAEDQLTEYEATIQRLASLQSETFFYCFDLSRSAEQFLGDIATMTAKMRQLRGPMLNGEIARRLEVKKLPAHMQPEMMKRLPAGVKVVVQRSPQRSKRGRKRRPPSRG